MNRKAKVIVLYLIIAAAAIASVVMVAGYVKNKSEGSPGVYQTAKSGGENKLFDAESFTLVKEKETISTEIIEDGLRNMGQLVTQEYFFTQAETYEKKEYIGVLASTAKMVYSYDGIVYAGVECSEIDVSKDDEAKIIYVTIPKAKITNVDIDFESFKQFESKQGLWSKIKLSDVNKSLQEFKNSAESNAVEKGVLDSADRNAESIIERFVNALIDNGEYTVKFIHE